jgi:hypothetical protein
MRKMILGVVLMLLFGCESGVMPMPASVPNTGHTPWPKPTASTCRRAPEIAEI